MLIGEKTKKNLVRVTFFVHLIAYYYCTKK